MLAPSTARTGNVTIVRMYVRSTKPTIRLHSRGVKAEEEFVARRLLSISINNLGDARSNTWMGGFCIVKPCKL